MFWVWKDPWFEWRTKIISLNALCFLSVRYKHVAITSRHLSASFHSINKTTFAKRVKSLANAEYAKILNHDPLPYGVYFCLVGFTWACNGNWIECCWVRIFQLQIFYTIFFLLRFGFLVLFGCCFCVDHFCSLIRYERVLFITSYFHLNDTTRNIWHGYIYVCLEILCCKVDHIKKTLLYRISCFLLLS